MKILKKKIQSNKGETLVEALLSLLIITLVAAMLAHSIAVSAKITRKTDLKDAEFRNSLEKASSGVELSEKATLRIMSTDGSESYCEKSLTVLGDKTSGQVFHFVVPDGKSNGGAE